MLKKTIFEKSPTYKCTVINSQELLLFHLLLKYIPLFFFHSYVYLLFHKLIAAYMSKKSSCTVFLRAIYDVYEFFMSGLADWIDISLDIDFLLQTFVS